MYILEHQCQRQAVCSLSYIVTGGVEKLPSNEMMMIVVKSFSTLGKNHQQRPEFSKDE